MIILFQRIGKRERERDEKGVRRIFVSIQEIVDVCNTQCDFLSSKKLKEHALSSSGADNVKNLKLRPCIRNLFFHSDF